MEGRGGGPSAFLHLGSRVTSEINSALTVATEAGRGTLCQRLEFQAPDDPWIEVVNIHDP